MRQRGQRKLAEGDFFHRGISRSRDNGLPILALTRARLEGATVAAVRAVEADTEQSWSGALGLARGGLLGGRGVSVLKVAKPGQDPRFDLPALGPRTLDALVEAGAGMLAFEAGACVLLQRKELIARADAAGIALLGVDAAVLSTARAAALALEAE